MVEVDEVVEEVSVEWSLLLRKQREGERRSDALYLCGETYGL